MIIFQKPCHWKFYPAYINLYKQPIKSDLTGWWLVANSVFCNLQSFLGSCKKIFGLFCTTYKEKNRYFSCIFILKTKKFSRREFRGASRCIYLFTYYLNLAFWMFIIAEILSSTYKIENFSRFLGQNTYFKHVFGHFKPIFQWGLHTKKHIFWRYKKVSVQKFFWDFLYMYKGGLCKKTLIGNIIWYPSFQVNIKVYHFIPETRIFFKFIQILLLK